MIPYILAAVGGYLLYDATKKQRSPLDNPYNILADGGEAKIESRQEMLLTIADMMREHFKFTRLKDNDYVFLDSDFDDFESGDYESLLGDVKDGVLKIRDRDNTLLLDKNDDYHITLNGKKLGTNDLFKEGDKYFFAKNNEYLTFKKNGQGMMWLDKDGEVSIATHGMDSSHFVFMFDDKKDWDNYQPRIFHFFKRAYYEDGGQTSDERYFIYKEEEKYLNQLKEGEIHPDDLETLLNNLFTDVHKVNRVNQSDFKEITKSEKDLIVKTAIGWGIAEMVDGKVEFVEKDDYDDEDYADGGEVGRFKILKDETGYVEQGFYGVFDTKNNELLDIFEFRKEAEGFVKELNKKGSKADASKYNGRINDYVLAKGGKVKWIQDALSGGKNKGALRRTAKKKGLLRGDENLSATDLKKLQKMGGTTAKRAHMAETLRKLK